MNPNEFYAPPNLENSQTSGSQMPSNVNVSSGFERKNDFARSVQKSRGVKQAASVVISTRSQLVDYLKQSNLDLLTSSLEFRETGDFIGSSYVVYKEYNDFKENLGVFIQRYPDLKPAVEVLRDKLRPISNQF